MTIAAVPPLPVTPLNEEHQAWLMKRGIPIEIATEAGLRSRGRQLLFPYTLSGTEIYVKIRGPEKKFFVEPSGVPLVLWGLDSLRDVSSDTLIVTEGEADALAWMTAGAPAVVSVPNGAIRSPGEGDINPLDDKRFQYLWTTDGRLLPILEKFRRIILSTDGDEPGIVLGNELAVRLGAERCWRLDYPEGCKDANDVLVQHGIDGLDALLKGAKPVTRPKLGCFYEIPEDDGPVYPVGMKLGNHIKICPPELFVVTGAPSAGKSQFTLCLVADLARLHRARDPTARGSGQAQSP